MVSPLTALNPRAPRVSDEVQQQRLAECEQCPKFHRGLGICGVCKCVMRIKTTLSDASCPLGKWEAES